MWVDIIQYLEYGVYVFYLRYILINCIFGEQFIILKNPLSKVNEKCNDSPLFCCNLLIVCFTHIHLLPQF